jgi:exopolysaccharide biosynthesis protein
MANRDLYDNNRQSPQNPGIPENEDLFSDIFSSIDLSEYEFDSGDAESETSPAPEPPAEEAMPAFLLDDLPDCDTYDDSGTYRSYDGSHEYRSFDAALPDAPEEGWYHYSDEDDELDEEDYEDLDEEEDEEDYEEDYPRHRGLKIFANTLLGLITALSIFYLVAVYSDIPFIANLRTMYIQTAMSTINHKWLATAIIPSDIIEDLMRQQYEADDSMNGIESDDDWGINIEALPNFENTSEDAESTGADTALTEVTAGEAGTVSSNRTYSSTDEKTFFELFYEVDYDSMQAYVAAHPDVLKNGWAYVDINEAGLEDDGTDIYTIHGDQVLALNAYEGVILIRVNLGSSRGVLAICKDTSKVSLCAATTLPTTGQTAGRICDANDGILAITGSAFMDDGTSNGGQISGLAVCNGVSMGSRLGGSGDKRLELRDDNKMYIVDSSSSVGSGTRDACEFHPALIIDGENVSASSTWTSPNPRAALGQSKYLETMMIIIEGRFTDSPGCSVVLVADKLLEYGCMQALNLDGGTSAIMYYDGEYVTRCSNTAIPSGRTMPSAWVYKKNS